MRSFGWRIPFLLSLILLGVSVYIRRRLRESPVFERLRDERRISDSPVLESFARWGNLKTVLLSLFGLVAGVGVVWYASQFYALIFMQKTLKVDPATASMLMSVSLVCAVPFFVLFGCPTGSGASLSSWSGFCWPRWPTCPRSRD